MCAAREHEEALGTGGNGFFTRAIVRALSRDAAAFYDRQTGELTVRHLIAFVEQDVQLP